VSPLHPSAAPASAARTPPARPQLKPALRRVWRDASTLQLGLDPSSAVVIGGLDPHVARLVESLDGTLDRPGVLTAASQLGVEQWRAGAVLELLTRAGVLDDAAADRQPLRALEQRERDRLAPDLAAISLSGDRTDGGVATLARRRESVVSIHGAGRVGASVVTLLASAGVGGLAVDDTATSRLADTAPAGLTIDDEGARRQDAALRAARRVAPSVRPRSRAPERPDIAVLAVVGAVDPRLPDRLVRRGVPHLFATVREGTGVVGPLVLPGRSSCKRCHDLHRTDRDPAWPSIAAQLAGTASHTTAPCDVVLATTVAAHAALQVLAFLDGDRDAATPEVLPTVDGTLEIARTDGRMRRRSWSRHPLCGCGWPGE
jgi:hypothetical protein